MPNVTGQIQNTVGGCCEPNVDDKLTFGASLAAAPTATAQDNDTFMVTSTGDATGTPIGLHKFDIETGTWLSADLDTDVSAINAALVGTNFTVAITEDGNTLTSVADLSLLLDDTDVSAVTATIDGATLTIGVTEDGVTVVDSIQLPDTDVSDVAVDLSFNAAGELVVDVTVTEDGVPVVGQDAIALPTSPTMWDIP